MNVSMTGIENGKEVIATGGFGGSGGLGGSCSFWNVVCLRYMNKMTGSFWKSYLEEDFVEKVDNGCCESKV